MTETTTKSEDCRDAALRDINSLYGIPGVHDCEPGHRMLIEVVSELGDAALTDEALELLAKKHREEDWRVGERAEAECRRKGII
jgi:hypothetical protein